MSKGPQGSPVYKSEQVAFIHQNTVHQMSNVKYLWNNYQKNNLIIIHYENSWCTFLKFIYLQERWRQRLHEILMLYSKILLILLISIIWSWLVTWFLVSFLLVIIIWRWRWRGFRVEDFRIIISYRAAGSVIGLFAIPACFIEVITNMAAFQERLSLRVCIELWTICTRLCAGHLSLRLDHNGVDIQRLHWFNWCSHTGSLWVNLYIYIR